MLCDILIKRTIIMEVMRMYIERIRRAGPEDIAAAIENARYSYSEIGERIGVSRVAVKSHINALEEQGHHRGIYGGY